MLQTCDKHAMCCRKFHTQPCSVKISSVSDALSGKRDLDDVSDKIASVRQPPQVEQQPFPKLQEALKGKLPLQSAVAEAEPKASNKASKTTYLHEHQKTSKKRNRLGQRARQQLGRQKQAQMCHNDSQAAPVVSRYANQVMAAYMRDVPRISPCYACIASPVYCMFGRDAVTSAQSAKSLLTATLCLLMSTRLWLENLLAGYQLG